MYPKTSIALPNKFNCLSRSISAWHNCIFVSFNFFILYPLNPLLIIYLNSTFHSFSILTKSFSLSSSDKLSWSPLFPPLFLLLLKLELPLVLLKDSFLVDWFDFVLLVLLSLIVLVLLFSVFFASSKGIFFPGFKLAEVLIKFEFEFACFILLLLSLVAPLVFLFDILLLNWLTELFKPLLLLLFWVFEFMLFL